MKIAIVGASGYTGLELLRIALRHPELQVVAVTSEQRAGRAVGDCFPSLRGCTDLHFERADAEALAGRVDFAFAALPHSESAPRVAALRAAGVAVAGLTADMGQTVGIVGDAERA